MAGPEVLVIGAGAAGLCCGLRLHEAGIPFTILEASDGVGGRIRTDVVEGFSLDRGFQVLLTAYPEARRILDAQALDLRPFYPGAKVFAEGAWMRVADPFRRPLGGLATLLAPIGSFDDKLRVAALRTRVRRGPDELAFREKDLTTRSFLAEEGFSDRIVERFFRPFFAGVFLDPRLDTSSRLFSWVYRMFSEGPVAVPAGGMQRIPEQLASRLPEGSIRLGAEVAALLDHGVRLSSGEVIEARAVVVATEADAATRLLGFGRPVFHGTTTAYFATPESPVREAVILLDGEGRGPVNNLAVLSDAAPAYAPAGSSLVAANVLGVPPDDGSLEPAIREQLRRWFGAAVDEWRHLRTYRIPHALPAQPPHSLDPPGKPARLRRGLYVCGDHRDTATLNGAMRSGRRAADALIDDL